MDSNLPALDRAKQFLETSDINFLITPSYFQAEVFIFQSLAFILLGYIAYKVSVL